MISEMYDKLPKLDCKGLCVKSCGAIVMSPREFAEIMPEWKRKVPTRPVVATRSGAHGIQLIPDKKGRCPLLRAGRCTVYEHRPMICRIVFSTERQPCPFGCIPERWLTDLEAQEMLVRTYGSTLGAKLWGES